MVHASDGFVLLSMRILSVGFPMGNCIRGVLFEGGGSGSVCLPTETWQLKQPWLGCGSCDTLLSSGNKIIRLIQNNRTISCQTE